jgi:hypothetical protein
MKGFHTGRTEMKNVPMETVSLDIEVPAAVDWRTS